MSSKVELVPRDIKKKKALRLLAEAWRYRCDDKEACVYAGITRDTLKGWYKKDPELAVLRDKLRNEPIMKARKSLDIGVVNDPNLALKYLERVLPGEFAQQNKLAIEGGNFQTVIVDYQIYQKTRSEMIEKGEITEKHHITEPIAEKPQDQEIA